MCQPSLPALYFASLDGQLASALVVARPSNAETIDPGGELSPAFRPDSQPPPVKSAPARCRGGSRAGRHFQWDAPNPSDIRGAGRRAVESSGTGRAVRATALTESDHLEPLAACLTRHRGPVRVAVLVTGTALGGR